jgi:hypothetical protein
MQEKVKSFEDAYIEYVSEHLKRPFSVYGLTQYMGVDEASFYAQFTSLTALENFIWKSWFDKTVEQIQSEEVYQQYTVREKLLAFYFSWIENLRQHRSFVTAIIGKSGAYWTTDKAFKSLKSAFIEYVKNLMEEGKMTNELPERPVIGDKYHKPLWFQLLWVMNFWVNDESENFNDTDAAIEKAVNVSFDIIGHNALDSVFDFVKFWYQHK